MGHNTKISAISLSILSWINCVYADTEPPINLSAHVRACESLYSDLEVRVKLSETSTDEHQKRTPIGGETSIRPVVASHATVWHVSLGGKYRVEKSANYQHDHGPPEMFKEIRMFDGKRTRAAKGTRVVNLIEGFAPANDFIRPHMFLIQRPFYFMALHELLSGIEVLASSKQASWPPTTTVDYEIHGNCEVGSLDCQHVGITVTEKGGRGMLIDLFLAIDRNLIPAKVAWYSLPISSEVPIEESEVTEWISLESDIWFPKKAKFTKYDPVRLHFGYGQRVQCHRELNVDMVSLHPSHPELFFQELEIADGAAVYEISDGIVTNSFRKGGLAEQVQFASPWNALIWINMITLTVLVIVWVLRRRNQL